MAVGSLLGKDDNEEKADVAFESFLDGLDKASEALYQFGNDGSAVSNEIVDLQDVISTSNVKLAASLAEEELKKSLIEQMALSGLGSEEFIAAFEESKGISTVKALDKEQSILVDRLKIATTRLSELVTTSLADVLDISTLSEAQLQGMVEGIDVKAMEALDTELNNIALAMKEGGKGYEDTKQGILDVARATEILGGTIPSTEDFARYKDNEEALNILNDINADRIDLMEDEIRATESLRDVQLASIQDLRGFAESLSYQETSSVLGFSNASNFLDASIRAFSENLASGENTAMELANIKKFSADSLEFSKSQSRTSEDYLLEVAEMTSKLNDLADVSEETTMTDLNDTLIEIRDRLDAIETSNSEDAIYA